MTADQFKQLLEQLSDQHLQSLLTGKFLNLVNDETLVLSDTPSHNCIELALGNEIKDITALRQYLSDQALTLYQDYYRNHVLTTEGFNRQLKQLINQHQAQDLVSMPGQTARLTLFVEDGEVKALSTQDPRHPYGASLELSQIMEANLLENRVILWVDSNDAYQQYLSMNVCRYNC